MGTELFFLLKKKYREDPEIAGEGRSPYDAKCWTGYDNNCVLYIKQLPSFVGRDEFKSKIAEMLATTTIFKKKEEGENEEKDDKEEEDGEEVEVPLTYKRIAFSDPGKSRYKDTRQVWIVFDSPIACKKALSVLQSYNEVEF